MKKGFLLLLFVTLACSSLFAQSSKTNSDVKSTKAVPKWLSREKMWFAWGYNKEWYTRPDIHVVQPALNNDYTYLAVKAHDNPGWNTKSIFKMALTIPQYNYRIGYWINEEKGWGIELNFDHTKHIIADSQMVRIQGTLNGRYTDSLILWQRKSGNYYFLNNGANFLLLNVVKRWNWYTCPTAPIRIDAIGRFGVGPLIPHVENELFGRHNQTQFQFGGWNTGLEFGIRASFYHKLYLEFTNKADYARYYNLNVYGGTAREAFGTYEMIGTVGLMF